tara:strand:+ start:8380 stop:8622 length:243 start_codon:yes stop_codon:yes gene_type:complete
MHHQIGIVKEQFNLFAGLSVKSFRFEVQTGLYAKREFRNLDLTGRAYGKTQEKKDFGKLASKHTHGSLLSQDRRKDKLDC